MTDDLSFHASPGAFIPSSTSSTSQSIHSHNDMDDNDDSSRTSTLGREPGREPERDELKEVRKLARAETRRVNQWRRLALFMIFVAGAGVSYMTFAFLESEEDDNHHEAVSDTKAGDDETISIQA